MDPVTQFLHKSGLITSVSVAYFLGSTFELGKELSQPGWWLVYRFDQGVLVISDFESKGHTTGIKSAVSELITFLKKLRQQVPEISEIRGLIIDNIADPILRANRKAFSDILLAQGAQIRLAQGERWLVY